MGSFWTFDQLTKQRRVIYGHSKVPTSIWGSYSFVCNDVDDYGLLLDVQTCVISSRYGSSHGMHGMVRSHEKKTFE
jgi:hypothetical protein